MKIKEHLLDAPFTSKLGTNVILRWIPEEMLQHYYNKYPYLFEDEVIPVKDNKKKKKNAISTEE